MKAGEKILVGFIILCIIVVIGYGTVKAVGLIAGPVDNTQSVAYNAQNLTQALAYYTNLADTMYAGLNNMLNTDSGITDTVITPLQGLNSDEVKATYKAFGQRSFSLIVKPFDRSSYNLRSFANQACDSDTYNQIDTILKNAGI